MCRILNLAGVGMPKSLKAITDSLFELDEYAVQPVLSWLSGSQNFSIAMNFLLKKMNEKAPELVCPGSY